MLESMVYVFCYCEVVKPIWDGITNIIRNKHDIYFNCSTFDKMVGVIGNKFPTYLFVIVNYLIFSCKFQNKIPIITGMKTFIKINCETEYYIANQKGKLSEHFSKWRFDF